MWIDVVITAAHNKNNPERSVADLLWHTWAGGFEDAIQVLAKSGNKQAVDKLKKYLSLFKSPIDYDRAILPYIQMWADIGLCNEPSDRAQTEQALKNCYKAIQQKTPKIIWFKSPIDLIKALPSVKTKTLLGRIWTDQRRLVEGAILSYADTNGLSAARELRTKLYHILAPIKHAIYKKVFRETHLTNGIDLVNSCCFGNHDAPWLAYYQFARKVLKLEKETKIAVHLIEQAKHAGWFAPFEGVCLVSERFKLKVSKRSTKTAKVVLTVR